MSKGAKVGIAAVGVAAAAGLAYLALKKSGSKQPPSVQISTLEFDYVV
jgi:hypothetical protein